MMPFRIKACLLHLAFSCLVAAAGLVLVFRFWYAPPLDGAVGVTSVFLMMLAIDVVLGPFLTLLVAGSKEKKTLKSDLAIILLIQLCAYLYGMHSIAAARPAYLVFDGLRFETVQANSVVRDDGEKVLPQYAANPWFAPQWAVVRPYKNDKEKNDRIQTELGKGISPSMRADLYLSLEAGWNTVSETKSPLSDLKKYNPANDVETVLTRYPQADSYQPLKAPVRNMTVLLDDKNKKTVAVVDLRPWQ